MDQPGNHLYDFWIFYTTKAYDWLWELIEYQSKVQMWKPANSPWKIRRTKLAIKYAIKLSAVSIH